MDNSLKWALFIKVSGQIASDTLWYTIMRIWRIFLFLKAVVNIPIQTVIIPYLISNGVCFSKIKIPYILTKPCHSLCPFSNLKFSFLRSCNSLETYNGKLMGSKTHTSLTRARNFPQLTHSLRDCLRGVMPFYFRNHENIHFTASIFLRQMV